MVVLSVIVIVLLIAGLAFYLFVVGGQLTRIAGNLEDCRDLAGQILNNAKLIDPGLDHINRTGGVVAGALPLLYGPAEAIVTAATTPKPEPGAAPPERAPALPAQGTRRSRLHAGVGYRPVDAHAAAHAADDANAHAHDDAAVVSGTGHQDHGGS